MLGAFDVTQDGSQDGCHLGFYSTLGNHLKNGGN